MRRTLLSATVPLLKAVSGMCVTFTALLNDRPLENTKNEGQLGKSKSHSRVVLKSSTKQKTTVFSTRASEKSSSDCKKEQQWKLSMYNSITPVCFTSPLIEKPVGKEPPAVTYRKDA
ncbi:uncharacterized protein LOC118923037 isoform X6 [Manis pentadactyla]|uniref:uncharacterized protein LOC118923037 isoform X6 n=1 Tax=Manis pentadactyla TaxID=143292 RepID=UPI00255C59D5|nr:uncharacterized protein LOC118923037 isoform X6 [Manis pentadactyla]